MSEKPGMSHLPRASIVRTPLGTRVPAVGVMDAMRPLRIVTVMSVRGAPAGVIGKTVTWVIATGSGAGAGSAAQVEPTNSSSAANGRDMVFPILVAGLRLTAGATGCNGRQRGHVRSPVNKDKPAQPYGRAGLQVPRTTGGAFPRP